MRWQNSAHSLVHVEKDVTTAVAVSLHCSFLRTRHVQVVVGQPRLFLHVIHVTDIMAYGGKIKMKDTDEVYSLGKHQVQVSTTKVVTTESIA